jgi:anaerobic magnesium-protoporphyrin IX monomethyl ester cyclase
MITSRGCPYTCSFCDRTVFERLYKTNSAQYTYEHMQYLRDRFGVHHINFYDDLFTANRKRVTELCELLIEKPLGMNFNCAIRTGHTSDEMLALLKRAGALMVSMGIESADPGMMERHKAGVTLSEVRRPSSRSTQPDCAPRACSSSACPEKPLKRSDTPAISSCRSIWTK